jgi:SAM-dependent methyltransferase
MWNVVRRQLPPAPASVLEIGCGSKGGFVPELEAAGYRATGIDPGAPAGPPYVQDRFEDVTGLASVDAVVASTSLHHVDDLATVLERVEDVVVLGGTVVVIEWAWERFDEPTARWCFERLVPGTDGAGWLERHRERWSSSGLPWAEYLAGWAEGEGLHGGDAVVRALDDRFERQSLTYGPYLFADLAGTEASDEAAAIDAGVIAATRADFVGRRRN